ncbi:MAG: alpha/beta fold hydrolase [Pseudomonadota bacterium]
MILRHQHFPQQHGAAKSIPPVVIIPGLFGSIANWRSFAQALSELTDVFVIEQRNHGESFHAPTQSYQDMVDDLCNWCDAQGLVKISLVGHSMGGKVAMCCAHWHPERLASLAVLDIVPKRYIKSHAPFLKALLAIDTSELSSRSDADKRVQEAIPDQATRLFLLQNLRGKPGEYYWRINLQVLYDAMPEMIDFPINNRPISEHRSLFLYGENSTYVGDNDLATLSAAFPTMQIQQVANAGHWLHADNPKETLSLLKGFLQKKD